MFKLYIGLSPYWRQAKDADDLAKKYYNNCIKLCRRVLFTYYNLKDFLNYLDFVSGYPYMKELDVMLDSGAFSIWREGTEDVNLDEYIDFALMLQEEELFKSLVFVSLDKIPGTVKREATVNELKEAVTISLNNYNQMKERGVKNVLYVYHLGEPIEWLGKVLDAGANYIGLGGLARGAGSGARKRWLDSVFSYLKNYPDVGTHGFGVTASSLVLKYPWRSVDSVTPFLEPGYGSVSVFDETDKKMARKYVSGVSDKMKTHLTDRQFLEKRFGVTFEQLTRSLWCRRYFSILEWQKFEEAVQKKQQVGKSEKFQQSILGGKK